MKTRFLIYLLMAMLLVGAAFAEPSTVTRSFSNTTPALCSNLTVSLAVFVNSTDTFYAIDDTFPANWTIADPGTGSTAQAGHIKWIVLSSATNTTYQYVMSVPCNVLGTSSFYGEYGFDNAINYSIGGQSTVNVVDVVPPVITLIGNSTITLLVNDTYTEEGANVTDNYDTNLTATITGTVDTSVAGTYLINYTAQDSSSNNATPVTRTVSVNLANTTGNQTGNNTGNQTGNNTGNQTGNNTGNITGNTSYPAITLIHPANGGSTTDTTPSFTWNVTDANSSSQTCNLYVDGILKLSNVAMTTGVAGPGTSVSLSLGDHDWFVNCTNSFNNTNTSSTWSFTIESSATNNGGGGGGGGGGSGEITLNITQNETNTSGPTGLSGSSAQNAATTPEAATGTDTGNGEGTQPAGTNPTDSGAGNQLTGAVTGGGSTKIWPFIVLGILIVGMLTFVFVRKGMQKKKLAAQSTGTAPAANTPTTEANAKESADKKV